jgi:cobalamin biosynthetic protein CobC
MLEHGGRLRQAARATGIALADWLDLSTGIHPRGWPVPPLPPEVWQRLPEDDDGLEAQAAEHYGNPRLCILPGSQAAIRTLPQLFPAGTTACLAPLYAEHPAAWEAAGHRRIALPAGDLEAALASAADCVVLCNPNNPTGHHLSRARVLAAAAQLGRRGAWLVVDEAFADACPEISVVDQAGSAAYPRLIVLRSLGKFFGLAGARVGFLFGDPALAAALSERLGPWSIAHPARWVARAALADVAWQAAARRALPADSQRLAALLAPLSAGGPPGRTPLFVSLQLPEAAELHAFLARRAILVRHFPEDHRLRFGLPGTAADWTRLATALAAWKAR